MIRSSLRVVKYTITKPAGGFYLTNFLLNLAGYFAFTLIAFGLACSAFGIRNARMPLSKFASAFCASRALGSSTEHERRLLGRSRRIRSLASAFLQALLRANGPYIPSI